MMVLGLLFLILATFTCGQNYPHSRGWCPCMHGSSYGMQPQSMYNYGYERSPYYGRRKHRRRYCEGWQQPPCGQMQSSYGMPPSPYPQDSYRYKPKYYNSYSGGLRPKYRGYPSTSYMSYPSSSSSWSSASPYTSSHYNMYGAPRHAYAGNQYYGQNMNNSMHGSCRW